MAIELKWKEALQERGKIRQRLQKLSYGRLLP